MEVAGILLTGGASRRMGRDKLRIELDGEPLAVRAARVLSEVCAPAVEVGPGVSSLDAVREEPPGEGPLAAVARGGRELRERGHQGAAIVLAADMPFVEPPLLRFLADFPGESTVVPFVEGQPQPLCARYSAEALSLAARLVDRGERSMQPLVRECGEIQWAGPKMWGRVASERSFLDLDTPEDLEALRPQDS